MHLLTIGMATFGHVVSNWPVLGSIAIKPISGSTMDTLQYCSIASLLDSKGCHEMSNCRSAMITNNEATGTVMKIERTSRAEY